MSDDNTARAPFVEATEDGDEAVGTREYQFVHPEDQVAVHADFLGDQELQEALAEAQITRVAHLGAHRVGHPL